MQEEMWTCWTCYKQTTNARAAGWVKKRMGDGLWTVKNRGFPIYLGTYCSPECEAAELLNRIEEDEDTIYDVEVG